MARFAVDFVVHRIPDADAIKFGDVELTYEELDAAFERAACALVDLGVTKGYSVALLSTNSDRFVIALYASKRLGANLVPINPSSAPPEIEYLLTDSGAAVLLFHPALGVGNAVTIGPPGLRWPGRPCRSGSARSPLGRAQALTVDRVP